MAAQYAISGTTARGISASVERAVADGGLVPGAALPPVRRLADELGVSPGTVATAYKELRQRGIVVTKGRGGTVVAQAPAVGSRRPPRVPEGVRDLAGGHPDPAFLPELTPPPLVPAVPGSHRASPRLASLEGLAREWFARDGVPAERVTFAHGALDCVGRLLSTELRPGDSVAVEDPGFHHLLDLVPALGLRMVPVAVDDRGMVPEALRTALRAGVRAVVCSPRGQNPVGGCFSRERRDALVEVLGGFPEVLVVEDDHNADVSGAPSYALAAAGLPRWAHVRTVSKHLSVDLRWAALACDGTTLARHDGRLLMTSGWISHVLQETAARLMADGAVRRLVGRAEEAYAERRRALIGQLARHGVAAHGASGLNVWVPVRDEAAVVSGLRSRGWWVAAGARFRIAAPTGVRVTTAELPPADAARLASDFAAVLGESEAVYGG
ncbi:aminotransferase class I/II-fold pyridoxal phosphate-dependent enzyme [Streptomyces sp. WAC05374]|uniref:aminotransferase class I/II-fold pyridoxal phosphate-dependent enzyme n=1 Tax=Streptomyces sp. WAC05374 TaxID=2487420 RepID=UPI000F871868|nr:aminotransferase class I/II-fold pyridoxal phosphate-dependent enzyme [Streptomyces sp. WAC05374]RST04003.1 aminotransferase class I/II-fold pyridoxal phosphate-dependent enzyme [Streptomyces sp. WAC05374]TDF43397.1 aminotransferase class I/II-fold pyridoxal phosphate-dependent enzyme [Streptomyces sp. WAC05374]TDF45584.1 aminotransferase class I/II-fold pyridoxal phosphate-dependent enzyme [Streptomyces sp. WAC05374]TDF53142.1 aminotransferase class I/II-fold pyridoxal phosphate-dependent e